MMEKILKFILLLLICVNANAQNDFPKDGDNIRNPNLDKFVGTWVWTNGNDKLEIILKKDYVKVVPSVEIYEYLLYGFHKYIKGGKEIENSMLFNGTPYNGHKHTLLGSVEKGNPNKLNISVVHLSKNKSVKATIEYIDGRHIKLIKVENKQGLMLGNGKYDYSIALPQNIILTRQ